MVIWIDILDAAWELSRVVTEVTHLIVIKTPPNKSWRQLGALTATSVAATY
jgi:hypothetical protein